MKFDIKYNEGSNSYEFTSYPKIFEYISDIEIAGYLYIFITDDNFEFLQKRYIEKLHKNTYFDPTFIGIKKSTNSFCRGTWIIYLGSNKSGYTPKKLSRIEINESILAIDTLNNTFVSSVEKNNNIPQNKILFHKQLKNILLGRLNHHLKMIGSGYSFTSGLDESASVSSHAYAEKIIKKWALQNNKKLSILDVNPPSYYIENNN